MRCGTNFATFSRPQRARPQQLPHGACEANRLGWGSSPLGLLASRALKPTDLLLGEPIELMTCSASGCLCLSTQEHTPIDLLGQETSGFEPNLSHHTDRSLNLSDASKPLTWPDTS